MKNRLWIIALIAISFTGCYTSFAPRDYESESYGKLSEEYYDSPDVASTYDSLEVEEYGYVEEYPAEEVTIINNYYPDYWGYTPSTYVSIGFGTWFGYYDPFYDPFYPPYYSLYYPYYGPNVVIYGDAYFGAYYGGYYSPTPVRYRNNRYYYTGLRNTGGRSILNRSRDIASNVVSRDNDFASTSLREVKGFDLDRDIRVTKTTNGSMSVGTNQTDGIRTASISKSGEVRTAKSRTTDLERRRVTNEKKYKILESKSSTTDSRESQRVTRKTPKQNVTKNKTDQSRSKRVYSSPRISKSNTSKTATRSYYRPSSRSSSRNTSVSGSTRSNSSSRSSSRSYSSSKSSSRSSVSTSRSGSSSSRSYSTPSRSSSSRSSSSSSSSKNSSRSRR